MINLPADAGAGIPISISEGNGIRSGSIEIHFDPSLLAVGGATVGEGLPEGAELFVDTSTAGIAVLSFTSPTDLPPGESVLANLTASVPADAASENYLRQQVIDLASVLLTDTDGNTVPSVADAALHLAAFFADVTGNGRVNAADAAQVARIAALLDTGFSAIRRTDPGLAADISGNRRVNAADASLLAQFAALIPVPEIPPIPAGVQITTFARDLLVNNEGRSSSGDRTESVEAANVALDLSFANLEFLWSTLDRVGSSFAKHTPVSWLRLVPWLEFAAELGPRFDEPTQASHFFREF